jgi:hypothetical protein
MKLKSTILAVLAVFALSQVSLAEEADQRSDQVGVNQPPAPHRVLHRHALYRSYNWYPLACESVIFPRSPLCAGRAPLPWDWECPWWGC